jgi:DNA polymerase-3 subunit alpha
MPNLTAEEAEKQFSGPSELCHLHNHTLFSILDGCAAPEQYFQSCAERKWPALAITEHGVLSSVPDAYLASKEFNVKFIVGIEFYFNQYERQRLELSERESKISDLKVSNPELAARITRNRHLTVLAKDMRGYENLLNINKEAYERTFYYKPRINLEQLAKYREGLIVLSGCLNGAICHELRSGNFVTNGEIYGAIDYAKRFKEIFGEDFYIELQMPGIEGEVEIFEQLLVLADRFKIKTIISNDSHYMRRDDYILQKIMMAIDQQTTVTDPNLFHVNSDEQFFKTRHELRAKFVQSGFGEIAPIDMFETACNNTLEVADKCQWFKPDIEPKLPKIENANTTLCVLALEGLRKKGLDKDTRKFMIDGKEVTYREQMEIELARIIEKDFASYFLISRSLVQKSQQKGWMVGPARGSAAGSLVCYLLDIVSINNALWGTSFDRFLSPSRGGRMLKVTMT